MSTNAADPGQFNELKEGDFVGQKRFELVRLLGKGGMGEVWLALDSHLGEDGRVVHKALKFPRLDVKADEALMAAMRNEVAKSQKLRHANIVVTYDWHSFPGEPPFLSMEYIDGESLGDLVFQAPGHRLQWHELRQWILQLCQALEYAHDHGIVHRDLKPNNLIIDKEGTLKLVDFGLARDFVPGSTASLGLSHVRGTPQYMSPQQMDGKPARPSDDIFSFGVTLYELLTGTRPFDSDYPVEPINYRLERLGYVDMTPANVRIAVGACMQRKPDDRPKNMHQLVSRLGFIDHEQEMVASDQPEPAKSWWPAAALLIVMIAGTWLVWDHWMHGEKPGENKELITAPMVTKRTNDSNPDSNGTVIAGDTTPIPPAGSNAAPVILVLSNSASEPVHFRVLNRSIGKRIASGIFQSSTNLLMPLGLEDNNFLIEAGLANFTDAMNRQARRMALHPGTNTLLLNFNDRVRVNIRTQSDQMADVVLTDYWGTQYKRWETNGHPVPLNLPGGRLAYYRNIDNERLPPGEWVVALEKPYYKTASRSFEVTPGPKEISMVLTNTRMDINLAPSAGLRHTNSLGIPFVWFPSGRFWAAIWEARVRDYQQFAQSPGYSNYVHRQESQPVLSVTAEGWTNIGARWNAPRGKKTWTGGDLLKHPVTGVSYEDAKEFCKWLTEKEENINDGHLEIGQTYQLPSDEQWSEMAGGAAFPWGNQWPPPDGQVNCAGTEAATLDWFMEWPVLREHTDLWPRTAPVDALGFQQSHGLFHLGGNVAEWCETPYNARLNPASLCGRFPRLSREDGYMVVRGGSWFDDHADELATETRYNARPDERNDRIGFRLIVMDKNLTK